MKKIMKSRIFTFILGAVIFGGITTVLAISSSAITYTNNNQSTVEGALDELYTRASNISQFCELKSGTALTVGSMYECDPGDSIKRNFYILEVREHEVDLIMEQNIAKGTMNWHNAMKYFTDIEAGINIKNAWTNVLNIDLPKAQAIANAVGNSEWKAAETNENVWWCLETGQQDTIPDQYCYNNTQNTMWLWDYLRECSSWHCSHSLNSEWAAGYWTRDAIVNTNSAWYVYKGGALGYITASASNFTGVRPVITVLKSNLYTSSTN